MISIFLYLEPIRKVVYSILVYGKIDLFDKAKYLYTIYHGISLISEISGIDSSYEIPDELWNQIFPLIVHKPKRKKKKKQGKELTGLVETDRSNSILEAKAGR